jgi:hypothetical protein
MPDFDFDAYNHEYPEAAEIAETRETIIEEPEVVIVQVNNIPAPSHTDEVDKW